MHSTRKVTDDLIYVGGSDRRLSRFENLFPIPKGESYNSHVLLDEKTVLFDTADESISRQYIENVVHALNGRPLDYMVVQHMEPDHCAMIDDMLRRYPEAKMVCSAKAVGMFAQFYGTDVAARALVVHSVDFSVPFPAILQTFRIRSLLPLTHSILRLFVFEWPVYGIPFANYSG